jgi:hypothetical protein
MGRKVWFPVVSGPLAPYAAGSESWLRSRAYSPSAAANRLCQFDQLSRWLGREGLVAGELTPDGAAELARSRGERGLVTWTVPQSATLPLEYLREIGVVAPAPAAIVEGPLEELARWIVAVRCVDLAPADARGVALDALSEPGVQRYSTRELVEQEQRIVRLFREAAAGGGGGPVVVGERLA